MKDVDNWIKELKIQILDPDDKVLFEETAGCFLSGHLRASYIMAWISIIESLKRKIQLFANLGDKRAVDAQILIEETENLKKSTDRLIFDEAKKCGILNNSDISTINFLWEQRCLFAHPYNKKPETDEVEHIIGQSIRLTLGKELFYNKEFVTELADNIANKPFFFSSNVEEVRNFIRRTIARIPEDHHPFCFKTFLFQVGQLVPIDEKHNELIKLRYFLIELFKITNINLDDPRWSLEDRVTKFPYECFIGFVNVKTWPLLPNRIRGMLFDFSNGVIDIKKMILINSITTSLVKQNVLEDGFLTRYHEKLNKLGFNPAIHYYGNESSMYQRINDDLTRGVFVEQNSVIDYLKTVKGLELINKFDGEKQLYLGRLIKSAALHGHYKSIDLIYASCNDLFETPNWVLAGIAIGSFISIDEKFTLDRDYIGVLDIPVMLTPLLRSY